MSACAGRPLDAEHYAWDGRILWLDATIETPTELAITFGNQDPIDRDPDLTELTTESLTMSLRPYLIAACCLLPTIALTRAEEPATPKKETFWLIPHTHWEGAVFKTREEYLEMGLPNILKAMRLLREQPGFRFTLDQVAYVRPFLERYPAEEADFRRFLAEGRLQLAGGAGRHARRQHARRRDVHPADAVRQGLLSREARG